MPASDPQTVFQAFDDACGQYAARPLIAVPPTVAARYAIDAGDISYETVHAHVTALRSLYADGGYGPGHRIAVMLENRPVFFYHWLALNALGASVVPINVELAPAEHAYLLSLSEADLIVYDSGFRATADAAVNACETNVLMCDAASMHELPRAARANTSDSLTSATECAMLFTSGSTGQPKACSLSNEYFLEMGGWYRNMGGLCELETGAERLITPLPLTHMNAMATSTMAMMTTGGCIVQLDRFHPKSWWQTVRDARATVIHYLGVMPAILLQLEPSELDHNAQIKFGFGAGVNPAHHAPFEQRFGFPLIEGWAMTETGAGGCIAANVEPRHVGQCCFGKPDPTRVAYRLVDESGNDVPRGEAGELLVRAVGDNPRKAFFSGYYKNDAATAEGWADGWWHTGDVAREIEDGSLCFVDRRKNIIRRSGENIAALEVEAVLSRHSAPALIAVTPVPDELRGEEVMACIVLEPEYEAGESLACEIFDHCRAELAYFKTPGYIAFVDELPLTATQKPKRSDIKSLAKSWLDDAPAGITLMDLRTRKKSKP